MPVVDKENPIYAVAAVASALLLASLLFVARVAVGARSAAAALPPIPKSGPLAEPRSSKQIGFPADQTKAVIPADNPQTAEKLLSSGDVAAVDRAAVQTNMSALGRFLMTMKETDIASFKTPGLRNVMLTGPYFHDVSQETLWDVMDHYNKGAGLNNSYLDEDIQPLALSESEIDDVVEFLASLTSKPYEAQGAKEL